MARTRTAAPKSNTSQERMDRCMTGLRDALLDEWDQLRAGTGDIKRAAAVAGIARQVLASVKVEVEFHRHVGSSKGGARPSPLRLGAN